MRKNHNLPEERNKSRQEKKIWEIRGNRALLINIIFFVILFIGIILVPLSGLLTASIVIIVAFVASLIYLYSF